MRWCRMSNARVPRPQASKKHHGIGSCLEVNAAGGMFCVNVVQQHVVSTTASVVAYRFQSQNRDRDVMCACSGLPSLGKDSILAHIFYNLHSDRL